MSQACAEWRSELGVYVIGALAWEDQAAMRRHLEVCTACRAEYEELLPVRGWLGRLAAAARPRAARLDVWPRRRPARKNCRICPG
jgi:anti-sigma factor RsiW